MRLQVAKPDCFIATSILTADLQFLVYAHQCFAGVDEFCALAFERAYSVFQRTLPINFKPVEQATTAKHLATVFAELGVSHNVLADPAVEVLGF